jgi:hypothetical protein
MNRINNRPVIRSLIEERARVEFMMSDEKKRLAQAMREVENCKMYLSELTDRYADLMRNDLALRMEQALTSGKTVRIKHRTYSYAEGTVLRVLWREDGPAIQVNWPAVDGMMSQIEYRLTAFVGEDSVYTVIWSDGFNFNLQDAEGA